MAEPIVLLVSETVSLGNSLLELFASDGIPVEATDDPSSKFRQSPIQAALDFPVIVSACNERHCETARRWKRGEIPGVDLVVVGTRDPSLVSQGRLHLVPLPVVPGQLLELVRGLLSAEEPSGNVPPVP
jgi:hypothetical protein